MYGVSALKARGITDVYGGYWTCNRLIFAAKEQIRCGVLGDDLHKGLNRYPAYWESVRSHPGPPIFVVRPDEEALNGAVMRFLQNTGPGYLALSIDGYTIYESAGPANLPD